MKRDGHIHSPYCPHGSTDILISYIEKAINEGFGDITFTEHAPIPNGFIDPTPDQDSFMTKKAFYQYVSEIQKLQTDYANKIKIRLGVELDYIVGFEKQTTDFLNEFGYLFDDAILSVHFLKHQGQYTCIDFSTEVFNNFAAEVGSVAAVYKLYYDTVMQSIKADLGRFKPKRIGHPTLIHKFQLAHGQTINDEAHIHHILDTMLEDGYELDVNSAGLSKKYCKEPYPPKPYITYAKNIGLPLIFGSDAHQVADLHKYYTDIIK